MHEIAPSTNTGPEIHVNWWCTRPFKFIVIISGDSNTRTNPKGEGGGGGGVTDS